MPLSKKCVFMTSHSAEGRKASTEGLEKRLADNMGGKLPDLIVFPEGTLNNGETIMKFKRGGFDHPYPINIRCSKFFQDGKLTPSFANMNAYTFMFIWLCYPQFFNEFYEIEENVDPLFLLKKNGVSPDDPKAWETVAREVKEVMMFMTGMQGSEQGYRDLLKYEKMECYAQDKMGGKFMRRSGCGSKTYDGKPAGQAAEAKKAK